MIITHIDLVRVFELRAFNQNINKKNSSKWRCYVLLGLKTLFCVNTKNLSQFVKLWIRVVDFDSYIPYIFVTCLFWSEQRLSCIHIMESTRNFSRKGRFIRIRPFQMRNLAHQWIQSGYFFTQVRTLF